MKQITNTVMMIKPTAFRYNEQTAVNNYYQKKLNNLTSLEVQNNALSEFVDFVKKLRKSGINVIEMKDTTSLDTPDSIFPNNWVSFHQDGRVVIYPMYAKNRRGERRQDIIDILIDKYNFSVENILDLSQMEDDGVFLEGTGSMVLDRVNKLCYAALSPRTHKEAILKFCQSLHYKAICFTANQDIGNDRSLIYHTNVMMCIADRYVIICLDSIDNHKERELLINYFNSTGKEIIEISEKQKERFAGNMLQIIGDRKYLIMSDSAYESLTQDQIKKIDRYNPIISSNLDTIEGCGGGSARCMIAEVFLPKNI